LLTIPSSRIFFTFPMPKDLTKFHGNHSLWRRYADAVEIGISEKRHVIET